MNPEPPDHFLMAYCLPTNFGELRNTEVQLPRKPIRRSSRRTPLRLGGCFAKPVNGHSSQVDAHDRQTDIDLEILDLLREESPKSAYRLAGELTRAGEEAVGTHAVRKRLEALASRGLVAGSASGRPAAAGQAEGPPALADPWRITEEGLAVVEPEAGVARALTTASSWAASRRRRAAVVATRASGS